MSTVRDNITEMNTLIASEKKRTHLSEGTILRVIDMNFALAQRGNSDPLAQYEPDTDEEIPFPEPNETGVPVDEDAEEAVMAAASGDVIDFPNQPQE
jgi:hypothetical protein